MPRISEHETSDGIAAQALPGIPGAEHRPVRWRYRDGAVPPGRVRQPLLRRAVPVFSRAGSPGPHGLRGRRRRRTGDQHLRGEPRQADEIRLRRADDGDQFRVGADRPGSGWRQPLRRRGCRSARHPHRAMGADIDHGGRGVLPGASGGARAGRCEPVRPRDLLGPQRDCRRHPRRPLGVGRPDHRLDDD